jgi:hypothetical protein
MAGAFARGGITEGAEHHLFYLVLLDAVFRDMFGIAVGIVREIPNDVDRCHVNLFPGSPLEVDIYYNALVLCQPLLLKRVTRRYNPRFAVAGG